MATQMCEACAELAADSRRRHPHDALVAVQRPARQFDGVDNRALRVAAFRCTRCGTGWTLCDNPGELFVSWVARAPGAGGTPPPRAGDVHLCRHE